MTNVLHRVKYSIATAPAFTVMEMMVATGVFSLIMGSILTMYICYARALSGVERQYRMNNGARVVNFMANEIKSALSVTVMSYDGSSLSSIIAPTPLQGNALSVTISNSLTTAQVYYFLDATGRLYRAVSNINNKKLWLDNITNTAPFTLKTLAGTVATNSAQRAAVNIDIYALDSNVRNFRQAVIVRESAMKRN